MGSYDQIKMLTISEIKNAVIDLDKKFGIENLHGFALGTDDDVRTLFHVVSTDAWVTKQKNEQGYEYIGYVFVEWLESADNQSLFLSISAALAQEADAHFDTQEDWEFARDNRFLALSSALSEIRSENVFRESTFLAIGSTDPSLHMQKLELSEIRKINTIENIDNYIGAMGY